MSRKDQVVYAKDYLEGLFESRLESTSPGSVFAVFDSSGIVYGRGFGRADDSGRAPTIDTAFRIASCTKSFTAATLLRLRDEGRLSLADPVDRYLTLGPLLLDGERVDAPTLGMLASMSGGFPTDDPWADRQETLSVEGFERMVGSGFRMITVPGTAYEYSNLGFALLGRVLEVVSGRSYIDLVMAEIVKPLGLGGIGFDRTVEAPDGVADGYLCRDGDWQRVPFSGPGAFSPIGGVFATPRALAGWALWLTSAFESGGGRPGPLGSASRREMQQGHRALPPRAGESDRVRSYGYGLVVESDLALGTIVSHSGGYPGFSSHMRWHPDTGIGVVGFENARYSGVHVPVSAALDHLIRGNLRPVPLESLLWPETIAARLVIERLLVTWNEALAGSLFAENVALDEPIERRRDRFGELGAGAGIADGSSRPLAASEASSESPAQLTWIVRGASGALHCEIRLTPESLPRVQTVVVRPL